MAGIGFELRKVVNRGGVASFFQIAMSGAMIVSGPWILSILTITLIQTVLNRTGTDGLELFMGVIIYAYAFSLFLFGGFHYIFTRRMSDLLYIKEEGQAFGYVLRLLGPIILLSTVIALPASVALNIKIPYAAVFKISAVLIFITVNCLWIIMLFVSVLKWYIKIMLVYASGFTASLLLIYLLIRPLGLAGALLGFSLGHMLIVTLLIILCRKAWKPEKPSPPQEIEPSEKKYPGPVQVIADFSRYAKKHRFLLGAGIFYYGGIWIDKFIFWISDGVNVGGTYLRLFADYDIAVYIANLTMIPGLIFFVVYSETEFYTALKRFLFTLVRGRYPSILQRRRRLAEITGISIKEQSLLQGIVSLSVILLAGGIIFKITLAAVFFHLLFLTLLNYIFYIEQYRHAFISSVVFCTVNAVLAVITASGAVMLPGISYLSGAAAASVTAGLLLKNDISKLDRYILTKK